MKNIYRPVVSDFNGGGTIVISNSDMLTITGSVTGTTAFETAGGSEASPELHKQGIHI